MKDLEIKLLRVLGRTGSVKIMEWATQFEILIHKDDPNWRDHVVTIVDHYADRHVEHVEGVFFIYPE